MRSFFSTVIIALALNGAQASSPIKYNKSISDPELDIIMTTPPEIPADWVPANFSDLAYPWPKKYTDELKQPYNSYGFLRNSAALIVLSQNELNKKIVEQQASFLAFSAKQYTIRKEGCVYITNDFRWGYLWGFFNKGFRGAFMNNVTAYGYINLYHATNNRDYLEEARLLLASTVNCGKEEASLSSEDNAGFFWLNEYVFQNNEDYDELYDALGYHKDEKGWRRARIYNGHIHALLAFLKYRNATGSTEFDRVIDASIDTMRHYLPNQNFENKYFSYDVTYPIYPDYGQQRAAHLAVGLCKITQNEEICSTSTLMREFYESHIRANEKDIYKKGYAETKAAVGSVLQGGY